MAAAGSLIPCSAHLPQLTAHRRAAWSCSTNQGYRSSRAARQNLNVRAQTVEAPTRPNDTASSKGGKQTPSYASLSDKYAIVDAAGTQMLLEEGRWYTCNRLQAEPGSTIKFGRVLAAKENGAFSSGRPYLENATVEAEILEELKGEKVIVYKMKPKKHYQRKNGHRQPLTKFLVTKIST
ncbi:hypothetical protein ABBQ38_010569 [Trebouxia sp. C0009 RCD-2024]